MSISNQLIKLNNIKIAIREALTEKGAEIDETTLFSRYASLIKSLGISGETSMIKEKIVEAIYSSSSLGQITDTVKEIESE